MSQKPIGPAFPNELKKAGLSGLPFSWSPNGTLTFGPSLTDTQVSAIQAVYSAHNASAPSLYAQIEALEASITLRMMREAFLGTTATINDPASPYNGMTAAQAISAIQTQITTLRAQL